MDKSEFNAWLAQALGALPEVASAGYNPEYPEDGVRLVMGNGYEVALTPFVPQYYQEEEEAEEDEGEEVEDAIAWVLDEYDDDEEEDAEDEEDEDVGPLL